MDRTHLLKLNVNINYSRKILKKFRFLVEGCYNGEDSKSEVI